MLWPFGLAASTGKNARLAGLQNGIQVAGGAYRRQLTCSHRSISYPTGGIRLAGTQVIDAPERRGSSQRAAADRQECHKIRLCAASGVTDSRGGARREINAAGNDDGLMRACPLRPPDWNRLACATRPAGKLSLRVVFTTGGQTDNVGDYGAETATAHPTRRSRSRSACFSSRYVPSKTIRVQTQ